MFITATLVWLSWVLICMTAVGVGRLALRLLRRRTGDMNLDGFRVALWWGLVTCITALLIWNLLAPLSGASALLALAALLVAGIAGWIVSPPRRHFIRRPSLSEGLLLGGVVLSSLVMSFLTLGMPINYDTGLYHLGSINYAHDFGTVPGLANVHDRFGFNSSLFSIAAVLSNGVWAGEGFRLVVGIFLTAMAMDLIARVLGGAAKWTGRESFMALTLGLGVSWIYVLQIHGASLASPAADSVAIVLILVSSVYLIDAFRQSGEVATRSAATAVILSALAGSMRPLNWLYWVMVIMVVWFVLWRKGHRRLQATSLGISGILLGVMLVRDTLLSGWLLFPMSRLPMPVDWRYSTPESTSSAITAWSRAPHMPFDYSLSGWQWFGPWLRNLSTDWFIVTSVCLLGIFVILFATKVRRLNVLYLACLPALTVLPIWFLAAPDPRFVWGQLLVVGVVPLSIAACRTRLSGIVVPLVGILLVAAVAVTVSRGSATVVAKDVRPKLVTVGPVSWTMKLAPPPSVETADVPLVDGTVTIEPPSDQCWNQFPLCRPAGSPTDVVRRGPDIGSGFKSAGKASD